MPAPSTPRFSFIAKIVAAVALIAIADLVLLFTSAPGAVFGLFCGAWALAVAATRRSLWRNAGAAVALALALAYAVALFDDPSLLALALFWVAISLAVLLPRRRFRHAFAWAIPLMLHALTGPVRPAMDAVRLARLKRRPGRFSLRGAAGLLALPVVGGGLFVLLFASANPLIATAFDRIALPGPSRILFWILVLLCVWPALRPWAGATTGAPGGALGGLALPDPRAASVLLALVTFNAIFAIQNGLDIAFLWSGAPLPGTITLADYAHRGAYSLIATALIAGGLALWMLRPGSAVAARPWARAMLALWVAQNLMLVASSILRTLDYVDAFSLTRLRIAALAWMLLVGLGLILIGWRILRGRSAAWLINANAASAAALFSLCTVVDLGAVAARWNVGHAREAGGTGPAIDLCYLDRLGDSALLPLVALEGRVADPVVRDRIAWLRHTKVESLARRQRDWRSWSGRGARRLAAAQAALGPTPPGFREADRLCGGMIAPPPPPPPSTPPTDEPGPPAAPPSATIAPAPAPPAPPSAPPERQEARGAPDERLTGEARR